MRLAWRLACACLPLIAGCTAVVAGDRVVIAGSTTVKPIVESAVQEFRKSHHTVKFIVGAGGSSHGIGLVSKSVVDIGMASRHLSTKEKEQASELVGQVIGLDGVVLIVNTANPLTNLTKDQVQAIYIGEITNWKSLGGPSAAILLYTLNSQHGTHDVFMEYFELETSESWDGAAMLATHRKIGDQTFSATSAKVTDDHLQTMAGVMTKPNAIGYVSIGQALQVLSRAGRTRFRLLHLNGVAPTIAGVQSGVYPLSRPLLLITRGKANDSIRDFIEFMTGPKGREIVRRLHYIPAAVH